ncbi:Membrane protein involved in the export of O-antigen and teichoic acid [Chitinophaga costaii]|uniref:Membrane protein involved in the export of O-antigen and teichoic acid n=1 Tax=Chitinophaga costaii TaxID=1335309 RepID=A0A1C4F6Z4_9BACT|nr:hypothetical protein [Chitinophaga costaii]PUZ21236.1 polysaccharide biosynthesis protein [Chitinophaga costaii]SCC51614.1 Membrane protein involved in the export of O-antigen and teichoic acid [Chitinophaga costaii]
MQRSYTKNYFKIYFWQLLSILLNLLSLMVVIPQLSSHPGIYGIYAICVSSVIFLSYADLGFMNAGFKFASEFFARGKQAEERQIIGLVSFILLIFVGLFMITTLVLSVHPSWLIKGLNDQGYVRIARQLLVILALFAPMVVLQRALAIIFGIRLQDFIYQRVQMVVNLCKIVSVFFFYRSGHSNIVGYFLFGQCLTAVGLLTGFGIAGRRYGIGLKCFARSIRFSRPLFDEIKPLALSTLFITISWILYYELDIFSIARLSGAQAVAFYSIGLTCQSFFRTILGMLFNPFAARFNHFIAMHDTEGLKRFYQSVICLMLPVVVFPILSIVCLSKPLVYSWVGSGFHESVRLVQVLAMCNIWGFISYPAGMLLIARKEIRKLYVLAIVQPVIFWLGVAVFFSHFGYEVFAWFQLFAFLISALVYGWYSKQFLQIDTWKFFKTFILPGFLPAVLLILGLWSLVGYLPEEKNKINLILVVAIGGVLSMLAVGIYYLTTPTFRKYMYTVLQNLRTGRAAG